MITKSCRQCLVEKPLCEFYSHATARFKRTPKCKQCIKANQRRYNQTDERKQSRVIYSVSSADKILAYQRNYEKGDKCKAYRRAYHSSDHAKARQKAYDLTDKKKSYLAAYRSSEHGKALSVEKSSRRRARLKESPVIEHIDWREVFARDRGVCQLCGCRTPRNLRGTYKSKAPQIDHIVPLAVGGSHAWSNVQLTCLRCNVTKRANVAGQMRIDLSDTRGER
jgi:5-methylcytosine-specific restriction endonuclease McrA